MPARDNKDKAPSAKAGQSKPSTNQSKGKNDTPNTKEQSTASANVKSSDLCVLCLHTVEEDADAMQCSFCKEFTHRTCDGRISETLYKSLEHDVNNVLLYLCIKCKPMILPEDASLLWKTFLGKIEKSFQDNPKREPLADKIMNKMSEKIEVLHGLTREYKKSLDDAQAALTTTQLGLAESNQSLAETQAQLRSIAERMHDLPSQQTNTRTNTQEGNPQPNSFQNMSTQTANNIRLTQQNLPSPTQQPPRNYPPPPQQNFPQPPQQNYPPPPLSSLNCFPTPGLFQNFRYPNALGTMPPLPYQSQFQSQQSFPPLPNRQAGVHGPVRYSDHAAHPGPTPSATPPTTRRPGHMTPHDSDPSSKPNTETTLVVYNTDKRQHLGSVVEDLMIKCGVYQHEVLFTGNIVRSATNKSPIYINCNNRATKWMFLRELNKLRSVDLDYKDVYARPYMSAEDLKTDRNLVRQLTDIRRRYPERVFKIQRGEIKEKIGVDYVAYGASLNERDMSVTNESYNSLPDLEEIVQTAQQLQQQSTPIHTPTGNGNSATQQTTDETTAAASSNNNTDQPSSAATVTTNNNGSTD